MCVQKAFIIMTQNEYIKELINLITFKKNAFSWPKMKNWEKILATYMADKGLISLVHKKLFKITGNFFYL